MPRLIFVTISLFVITACAHKGTGPGTLPDTASSGLYSSMDQQTVAKCIARALGTTVQSSGDRLVIASTRQAGVSYSVAINKDGVVYPTQIAIIGLESQRDEADSVARCAQTNSNH